MLNTIFTCCFLPPHFIEAAFKFETMTDHDIIAFYSEKNEKTDKFHWQHMESERMLSICKHIATKGKRPEDRKSAAGLALEVLNFNPPKNKKK